MGRGARVLQEDHRHLPQSTYRADAKLGVGDAYLGEKRVDSLILGVNEFKEFLQYFPLNPKADYAQYRICAAESKQMLSPQRDQTATREALRDCDAFLQNNPTSKYRTEGEALRRQARDRLSESEFEIGVSYLRMRWYAGRDQPPPRSHQGRSRILEDGCRRTSTWERRSTGV